MRGLTLGDPALLGGLKAFSPLDLSPEAWYDASDTSTITSSGSPAKVSQWNDKSGNGRNVTQATAAQQPGTGSVTQNGLNVLTFDGSDWMTAATASDWKFLHDGTDYIAAAVVQWGTTANPATIYALFSTFDANNNANIGIFVAYDDRAARDNQLRTRVTNGTGSSIVENVSANNLTSANQFTVFSMFGDPNAATASARSSLFSNASAAASNNAATGTPSSSNPQYPLNIGVIDAVNPADRIGPLLGRIGELVIVSGANATEANRVALRDYLNAKWAVY